MFVLCLWQSFCSHTTCGICRITQISYSDNLLYDGYRVYPTFCGLQALIHYILCFLYKKIQYLVGKLLKNMWIKFTNAVIAGGIIKY